MCKSKTLNISLDFADILWFHAICISKGCIQICEPLGTFNTVLTCASNHPQNILHASPPSPDVLSCSMHQCTSKFHTHHAEYSPNLQKYTTHQLGIYSTLYPHHPKILKIYVAKDHAQAHTPIFI